MLFETWLEGVETHFDALTVETLLSEAPHSRMSGPIPPELAFLGGAFVDFGFENLKSGDVKSIFRAFSSTGVGVPGTSFRLRFKYPHTIVEPADGTEMMLPLNWKQAVLVMNQNDKFTYIGKLVRPEQVGGLDITGYHDAGDAYTSG